jgi:hypothetical protein
MDKLNLFIERFTSQLEKAVNQVSAASTDQRDILQYQALVNLPFKTEAVELLQAQLEDDDAPQRLNYRDRETELSIDDKFQFWDQFDAFVFMKMLPNILEIGDAKIKEVATRLKDRITPGELAEVASLKKDYAVDARLLELVDKMKTPELAALLDAFIDLRNRRYDDFGIKNTRFQSPKEFDAFVFLNMIPAILRYGDDVLKQDAIYLIKLVDKSDIRTAVDLRDAYDASEDPVFDRLVEIVQKISNQPVDVGLLLDRFNKSIRSRCEEDCSAMSLLDIMARIPSGEGMSTEDILSQRDRAMKKATVQREIQAIQQRIAASKASEVALMDPLFKLTDTIYEAYPLAKLLPSFQKYRIYNSDLAESISKFKKTLINIIQKQEDDKKLKTLSLNAPVDRVIEYVQQMDELERVFERVVTPIIEKSGTFSKVLELIGERSPIRPDLAFKILTYDRELYDPIWTHFQLKFKELHEMLSFYFTESDLTRVFEMTDADIEALKLDKLDPSKINIKKVVHLVYVIPQLQEIISKFQGVQSQKNTTLETMIHQAIEASKQDDGNILERKPSGGNKTMNHSHKKKRTRKKTRVR